MPRVVERLGTAGVKATAICALRAEPYPRASPRGRAMGEGGFVSPGDHALWAMGVLFMMAGCGGHTTSGVTCGPGTVLAGEVCLPAPSGNDGSAGVNPDGMAQEAGPDG